MMGMFSRLALIIFAMMVAGCDVKSKSVPTDDRDQQHAVLSDLSPFVDGRPDPKHDGRMLGEEGSDRRLFLEWLINYESWGSYAPHRPGDPPPTVPDTVGEAIEERRGFYEKELAQQAAKVARNQAEQRREQELDEQRAVQAERDDAVREAQAAVDRAAADAKFVADTQAQAGRDGARQDCIDRRQNAALEASPADYQRVWHSFPACESMP